MKNKKYIIVLIIILVVLAGVLIKNRQHSNVPEMELIEETKEVIPADYVQILDDGSLKNDSEKLKENKEIDELKISNIGITGKNDEAVLTINIENTSQQAGGDKDVIFVMKDKQENEIGKIALHVNKIEARKGATLEINTEFSLINTYDFEIVEGTLSFE